MHQRDEEARAKAKAVVTAQGTDKWEVGSKVAKTELGKKGRKEGAGAMW